MPATGSTAALGRVGSRPCTNLGMIWDSSSLGGSVPMEICGGNPPSVPSALYITMGPRGR